MSDQGDLFGRSHLEALWQRVAEPPAQRHSATSKAAAKSIKQHIGPLHQKIIDFLMRNPGGACDEKMGIVLRMGLNTLRPRRRELQLMGRVKDSGRTELTVSGHPATVWILEVAPAYAD